MTRSLHLGLEGNFYIAPYEYFISGWRSPERSRLTNFYIDV